MGFPWSTFQFEGLFRVSIAVTPIVKTKVLKQYAILTPKKKRVIMQ